MNADPPRVASLLPSATEIVCALGMAEHLVGVSHECDYPAEVVGLPVLTSARLSLSASSATVDRDVRRLVRQALAVYEVDVEALSRVRPDVVVTQDLCDVCAVSLGDVEEALRRLARPGIRIVSLRPTRLADVLADVGRVGAALGRPGPARDVLDALAARIEAVRRRTASLAVRPRVLTLEWLDPPMVGGTWMPELVEAAGGRPLVTAPGERAPTLSLVQLAALDPGPEVVLIKPCGFSLERTRNDASTLRTLLAAVRHWPAVARGEVWLADGSAYFNRPGPRIVDSLEILAAILHPQPFADLAERHAGAAVRWT